EAIGPSGTLAVVAGRLGQAGPAIPGVATRSDLDTPDGVAVDSSGNLYIADTDNDVIEKVTPSGNLSIIAGMQGQRGFPIPGPATSSDLYGPHAVAVDGSGNLYIADTDNDVIEKVTPSGTLSIIAGTGQAGTPIQGPATGSAFNNPEGLAVSSSGNVYVSDTGNSAVEEITQAGQLSIVAGKPFEPAPIGGNVLSDLSNPEGVAIDGSGDLYIAGTYNAAVEELAASGTMSIVAGNGQPDAPTPGTATDSSVLGPEGLAVSSSGNLYIADTGNDTVEEVTPAGQLSIIGGVPGQSPTSTQAAVR
ncbi:MAG: hypothetical protein ACRDL5_17525, partial [Solirubrobacteraceae bacterium]